MAFVKFQGIRENGSSPLAWGRADLDRAPYRGPQLPLLKGEEAETVLERAYDVFYGTFDTSQSDQQHFGHTLQQIIDRSGNDWYSIQRWNESWGTKDGVPTMYVFVVWQVPYMQPKNDYIAHASNFLNFPGSTAGQTT